MSSSTIITWLIAACVIFAVFVFFPKPIKAIANILINALAGCIGFLVGNFALSVFGLTVGINPLTALIVGILGIPGFVLLYAVQIFL